MMRSTLTTERLQLRPYEAAHAPQVWQLVQRNRERLAESFQITCREVTDEASARAWIEKHRQSWANDEKFFRGLFLQPANTYIGMITLKRNYAGAPMAELAYYIDAAHEGQGLMSEALQAVTHWGFYGLGIPLLYLRVEVNNAASNRLAEKLGFELTKMVPDGLEFPTRKADMNWWQKVV